MAEAALKLTPLSERDNVSVSSVRVSSDTKTNKTKRTTTTIKDLESKMADMEKRVDDKFDKLLSSLETLKGMSTSIGGNIGQPEARSVSHTDNEPSGLRRPLLSLENSLDNELHVPSYARDDVLSLQPSRRERTGLRGFLGDSDNESSQSSSSADFSGPADKCFDKYIDKENNCLGALFNTPDTDKSSSGGLILDQSQIDILSNSWRCENPERLSCYKDEYRLTFPVHSQSETFLQVPGLDDLIEPMLQKRHGSKAVKSWGKGRQLHSQPLKTIESVGFQGQMATRMGIIAMSYLQQGLGALIRDLQTQDPNIDRCVQTVRDIFSMSTKALDQVGRSGAFFHIIRRKAAISDTGLNTLRDVQSKVLFLPLSGDGVFGKGLEDKLKHRKEQKDQLNDLVPELQDSRPVKRKFISQQNKSCSNDKRWSSKKQKTDFSRKSYQFKQNDAYKPSGSEVDAQKSKESSGALASFRIPKRK